MDRQGYFHAASPGDLTPSTRHEDVPVWHHLDFCSGCQVAAPRVRQPQLDRPPRWQFAGEESRKPDPSVWRYHRPHHELARATLGMGPWGSRQANGGPATLIRHRATVNSIILSAGIQGKPGGGIDCQGLATSRPAQASSGRWICFFGVRGSGTSLGAFPFSAAENLLIGAMRARWRGEEAGRSKTKKRWAGAPPARTLIARRR